MTITSTLMARFSRVVDEVMSSSLKTMAISLRVLWPPSPDRLVRPECACQCRKIRGDDMGFGDKIQQPLICRIGV